MDFWTFAEFAPKQVRVILKNGKQVKGWIYYQIIDFTARPIWVKEFWIMKDNYETEVIICDEILEIYLAEEKTDG